ncbi:MAG: hypothetical protein H6559_20070 [Lewinellaceae bacterium]|nr:hypothetical protein [Lewinellaceae bacterium]
MRAKKPPKAHDLLDIRQAALQQLLQDEPESMTLVLPTSFRAAPIEVLLVKVDPFRTTSARTPATTGRSQTSTWVSTTGASSKEKLPLPPSASSRMT